MAIPHEDNGITQDIAQARFERLLLSELERQKAHIARELHDSLGSVLAGVSLMVGALAGLSPRNRALADEVQRVQQQIGAAVDMTRALARGLLPVQDHPDALWKALQLLCANLSSIKGVDCRLDALMDDVDIPPEARNHLYRIAQEAVSNALRHGKATTVWIRFYEAHGALVMAVEGNGGHFDVEAAMRQADRGMGLRSIMARAHAIGGQVRFEGRAGGGSRVVVAWRKPLRKAEACPQRVAHAAQDMQ